MATQVITMELLGRGTHTDPRDGCNVLELASVLAGERWSTSPQSVHPALATAAETVNAGTTEAGRRPIQTLALPDGRILLRPREGGITPLG